MEITADQARENAEKYRPSEEKLFHIIYNTIDLCSKEGEIKKRLPFDIKKTSKEIIEHAVSDLIKNGFKARFDQDNHFYYIHVSWELDKK